MRRTFGTHLLVLFLACAPGNTVDTEANSAADEAAIRNLIANTAAANNAADSLGWAAFFEDGAVYMPPGSPEVTTREGLLETAAAGFGSYAAAIAITPREIVVAGDWAFARTYVGGSVTPRAGGDPVPVDAKQIVIFHRQPDGVWKIARLITNPNS